MCRWKTKELLDAGRRDFVLNLANVSYIDSFAIGQMFTIWTSIRAKEGHVVLLQPVQERVRRLEGSRRCQVGRDGDPGDGAGVRPSGEPRYPSGAGPAEEVPSYLSSFPKTGSIYTHLPVCILLHASRATVLVYRAGEKPALSEGRLHS